MDGVRGSDYPAIVEYAAFQGLPKSRARKKDKNVGTIEECDHFLSFLEQLKKEEDEEPTAKNEVTYSYRLKDDKKITSTPLIEFLAAKNQEKRDAKVRNICSISEKFLTPELSYYSAERLMINESSVMTKSTRRRSRWQKTFLNP